ncbi:Zn(II)2Cys6 transcription factor domain-containing protein [Aspergillus mulundensis]|uniref:Zn(2)-C6 fungal-type domain-containing protein n=1 Tax=Aspergillus mulundensis TaxID=1810919 RepID=A0A3D8SIP1_9EURO|nr:hypothetical protein DSM5745_02798 [Aspergillus mulundensis]RDW86156.1 hypothetical protein DSM5745_02798 [Aspergillus mulundensis]
MDLEYRGILAQNGFPPHANLITPPATSTDSRNNPRLPRPLAGFDFSARSSEPGDMEKAPPVTGKRRGGCRKACNECRQQKLRCDIVQTPADACSRCLRLHIECKVEPSFKRISKRKRNAEMEREIADLRQRLSSDGGHVHTAEARVIDKVSQSPEDIYYGPEPASVSRGRTLSAKLEPQTLATPLTMHSDGSMLSQDDAAWRLEDVSLSRQRITRLFDQYVVPAQ